MRTYHFPSETYNSTKEPCLDPEVIELHEKIFRDVMDPYSRTNWDEASLRPRPPSARPACFFSRFFFFYFSFLFFPSKQLEIWKKILVSKKKVVQIEKHSDFKKFKFQNCSKLKIIQIFKMFRFKKIFKLENVEILKCSNL
jgi:hypothetical protein